MTPKTNEDLIQEFMKPLEPDTDGVIHVMPHVLQHKLRTLLTEKDQELQKAREELVYEIRADLLNYRDERLDDNASITNIAIRIGLNYTRKDQSELDQANK